MGIRATRYLPHAVLATMVVALLPIAVVWGARAGGVISSPWLCVCVTVALSLIASAAGSWYWKRRPECGDVLFSELLLWGWLRRLHVEHQLDMATKALGLATPGVSPGTDGDRAGAAQVSAERRLELLTRLADALEAHDPYVDGHSRRVARHATMIARRLGLSAAEVARVGRAAAVHDVGKLRLPREILMKPSALTDAEFEIIKRHSTEGAEMVACLGDSELTAFVRHHHERLDGSGYPAGLHGEQIPLGARIIAVADTFDAITSARPYRPSARHKQAIDILIAQAGVQLDPDAVRAFISYYSGNRILVVWAILGAIPQRAITWVRRTGGPAHSVPAMPTAASTAALIAVSAVAVVSPIGLGHSPGPPAGRQQGPLQQLAAVSPPTSSVGPRGGSHHHARRARSAARGGSLLHPFAGELRVVHAVRRRPETAPGAPRRSDASPGRASPGNRSVGLTKGSAGVPNRPARGGSSSGPGGVSIGRSGGGPGASIGASGSATSPGPVSGTAVDSGGGIAPGPGAATTGGTPTGGTTGGTTGSTTGGTTGGTAGGTTGGTAGGGTPASQPMTKAQCMNGGYAQYGFKNQGQCIDFVVHQ
jgi:HD domain